MREPHSTAAAPVEAADGHRWSLECIAPERPRSSLLWLPALGVAAKHYRPFAAALAARGVAVYLHEWRGHGSSSLRAGRACNWGYRELLSEDLPASRASIADGRFGALPHAIGGHSLGGQLAACRLGLAPESADRLWLVASGAPYWRAFPVPSRFALPLAYRLLPALADAFGALPGRRIGFGGREARGVMRDWARSAMTGRYAAAGLPVDLDRSMAAVRAEVRAVCLQRDWFAPQSSLAYLLGKLQGARCDTVLLDDSALGVAADHFRWMTRPDAVAAWLTAAAAE